MAFKDIKIPDKALLITGVIYAPGVGLDGVKKELESGFGKRILEAGPVSFIWTNYYDKEMGKGLLRYFTAFERLVDQGELVDMKYRAMEMEDKWISNGARRVNIDPGLLTLERLVLATTKNFTHRIYLGRGIYGDLTLIFQKGDFRFLDWTYPDYKSDFALEFLRQARTRYITLLKGARKGA